MKCKVKVVTDPACATVNDFSAQCKRKRSQIEKAIADGVLNHGEVFGKKVVILDLQAKKYKRMLKNWDKVK